MADIANETPADIAAELRAAGICEWSAIADRIEAAAKREAHEAECKWSRIGYNERKAEENRTAQSNAAAMREAAILIRGKIKNVLKFEEELIGKLLIDKKEQKFAMALSYAGDALRIVNTALSATPRNCDRFKTEQDAQVAFLNEVWLIYVTQDTLLPGDAFNNWTDKMKEKYSAWLFSPATVSGEAGEGGAECAK